MTKRVFSSGFLNSDLQHNSWYSGCVKINCSFSVKYYPLLACFAVRVRQDGYSFLIYLFLNLLSFWFLWGVYIIITSQFSMKIENFQFSVKKKKKKEAEKGNCLARMWLLVWTPALHYVVMNVYYFFLIALTKALYRGPVQLLFECQMVFCLTSLYTKEQNIPTGWSRSWWGPQCFQSLTWYACSRHLIHKCDCSLDQSRLSGESWQCV